MERLTARARRNAVTPLRSVVDMLDHLANADRFDSTLFPEDVQRATLDHDRERSGWGGDVVRSMAMPLDLVLRDLGTDISTAGGALIGSPRQGHAPSLRGFSVVASAGATVVTLPVGSNAPGVPTITTPPVAGWAADQYSAVPESNTVFALKSVAPSTLGFWFRVSRKLLIQGGEAADRLLRAEIARAIGRGLDKAALQGTGSAGQPLGLNGISGVHAQSGTSLNWAGIQNMLQNVTDGGAADERVRFIGTSAVRELLATREKAAGSGLVWDDGRIAGKMAHASLECPSGTLFCGDFSALLIALHGPLEIMVDRRNVTDGSAKIVALIDADVQALYPAAFSRATSIT
jgi:HK97 family phage major capsid protein